MASATADEYRYSQGQQADGDDHADTLKTNHHELAVNLWRADTLTEERRFRWLHSYTQLKQSEAVPLHNGHLHFSRVNWEVIHESPDLWQHAWQLGWAMSSNRFKELSPTLDGIVLAGASWKVKQINEQWGWLWGIQANYLFQRYRVAPEIGVQWRLDRYAFNLTTSSASLIGVWNSQHRSRWDIKRFAHKWDVESNETGAESEVYWRGYETWLRHQYRFAERWRLGLGVGWVQTRELSFSDAQAGSQQLAYDGSLQYEITIRVSD